jgi:hypothetical protein
MTDDVLNVSRPDSLNHYAQLRKLLIQHAELLAPEIDCGLHP